MIRRPAWLSLLLGVAAQVSLGGCASQSGIKADDPLCLALLAREQRGLEAMAIQHEAASTTEVPAVAPSPTPSEGGRP